MLDPGGVAGACHRRTFSRHHGQPRVSGNVADVLRAARCRRTDRLRRFDYFTLSFSDLQRVKTFHDAISPMDPRVTELHCIMPLVNVPSVMIHGILSYYRASRVAHRSVALQPVQDKRDKKQVPGGLKLHQYANLYFHARNPMLFKRKTEASVLCVLRVSTQVLSVNGTVITDQNAASDYVRFLSPTQWDLLPWNAIFARNWTHPDDRIAYWRHRAQKCAEVLVPNGVAFSYVNGAYVVDAATSNALSGQGFALPIDIDSDLFFY